MQTLKKQIKKLVEKIKIKLKNFVKVSNDFAANNEKIVKVSGAAVGIIICSVLLATFFTTGYEVYLDGQKVAVINDISFFENSFVNANEQIGDIAGDGYKITTIPKYVFTISAKASLSSENEIVDNVIEQSNAVSKVFVIKVDGRDIATAETEEIANRIIDQATASYDGENKQILNKVEIVSGYEALNLQTEHNRAVYLLSNVLKVQTEKISVYTAALVHSTEKQETADLYINEEQVLSAGKDGVMQVTAKVTEINGVASGVSVISTNVIEEPVNEVVMVGTTAAPSIGTGNLIQPYFGTITSRFGTGEGRRHKGIDICGHTGDPVYAADNGIVLTAEYQTNGYGNIIIIDHRNGMHTWYAHLDSINVTAGETIEKGALIGKVGNTGYSTGPHLHFEVRKDGKPVNPGEYVKNLR